MNLSRLTFAGSSLRANGIKFVDEDDCWSFLSRQVEGIPDHLGSITDVHLHKLWTSKLKESCLGLGGACSGHERLTSSWWTMHEKTLWWSDTNVLESLLVRHWENDGFGQLLDLFVETANIGVVLSWSLINLHSHDSGVILWWQLLVDDEAFLIDSNKLTWLQVLGFDHAWNWQVNGVSSSGLDNESLLFLGFFFIHAHDFLSRKASSILIAFLFLFWFEDFTNVGDHMRQLSSELELFSIIFDSS